MYQVLLAIQYIGIAVLLLEIFFVFFRTPSKIQRDMIFLLFSLLVVFLAYTMEMRSESLREALSAIKLGYLGKPLITFFMLLVILDYCRIQLSKSTTVLLWLLQLSVTLVVFTAEKHMLFYSSMEFTDDGLFPHAVFGHGPLYYAYVALLAGYCVAMLAVCFWQLRTLRAKRERRQLWLFIAMILVPFVSLGLFLANVTGGYDCTLAGYLISTLGFSVSFFGLHMFDTITLAKEQVVDYIHCGLIVYDNRDKLIYHNDLVDRLDILDKAAFLAEKKEPYVYCDRIYSVESRVIEDGGFIYGNMLFIQDVTERYDYEERLREEKQRADEASEAKTNFLSSMSHDIRTPMNAILGLAKIAHVHMDNKEKVADCLRKIDLSGRHLLELINEILDMNKIESGMLELDVEPFDMGELLEEVLTMARPLAEGKKHDLIVETGGIKDTAICGDRSRLSQILMNLLSNAVKYTNDGGTIQFTAYEGMAVMDDCISYTFIVSDNGIGMSEDYLPRIFDPFTRAKDSEVTKIQGSGLGMAITKRFVELMDGEISVTSKLGEGSTFIVRIPLKIQTEEEAAALAREATLADFSEMDFSSKRVLLVEDNEINAEIAGEILGMTGIAVEYAVNGMEAVERIAACEDGYYNLIFMDVQMPVMDGYDATRTIRAMDREYAQNVPIVAMTANAFAEDVRAAKESGMNDHIAKPIDVPQLMTILQKWA